jgi:hypothetical protein
MSKRRVDWSFIAVILVCGTVLGLLLPHQKNYDGKVTGIVIEINDLGKGKLLMGFEDWPFMLSDANLLIKLKELHVSRETKTFHYKNVEVKEQIVHLIVGLDE